MNDDVTETWLVGVVAHDEALSSIRVHAGYLALGPTTGRDHRIFVRLRFGDPEAPSFPDAEASAALIEREDTLVARLGERALLVAVLTSPGCRDLIFHTGEPEWCAACLDDGADASGDGSMSGDESIALFDFDIGSDPAWSTYRGLFTDAVPADTDRRRIHDASSVSGESTPVRDVEHRFAFPTLAEADQAAAALRDAGLVVIFVASDDLGEAAPPRFTIVETEALTQVDMARSRDALAGFAVSWGGDYLGWEVVDP